ncbi:MauE/DoxX family redox-associated membrane protein [Brevibacillus sp. DP1.3A]|uniref:MauE/DoxX family redox-associated membrane protein n=1 Tax=Brevibacillus sp. DP1.3A TaxID=2738867 RepID=UPI00156AF86A|nr:MauE/DoxX family redox-associated membrane protein [Brevibacillus sp. DP1.3A]UED72333.1 hypothetical protein HP399_016370 [Brevibacillus sp. DP1.3A]
MTIIEGMALGFGLLFCISFCAKCMDRRDYFETIRSFEMISDKLVKPVGIAVLATELILSIFFTLFFWVQFTFLLSLLLLIGFSIALLKVKLAKKNVSCHCFGKGNGETNLVAALIRNGCLVSIALFGVYAGVNVVPSINSNLHQLFMTFSAALVYLLAKEWSVLLKHQ